MNIFISNLSFNTGDAELNALFATYGDVTSAKVITDRETGRSRGFGFVEMPSTDQGNDAITGLNNKEVEGRAMTVSVAKEKQRDNNSGYGRNSRNDSGNRRW